MSLPFDPDAFAVDLRREGATCIVLVRGELDHQSAGRLSAAVRDGLAGSPSQLMLDLSEVTFVDSSGLSGLLDAVETAKEGGVPTQTLAVSGGYARTMIELTRTQDRLGLR